jgi:predicted P-loop ATPase
MSQYQQILEDLREVGFDFRINDLDETLEVKLNGTGWKRIDDTLEAIVKTDMRELGYGRRKKPGLAALHDAYIKLAHQQRYNPIKLYLEGLRGKYEPSTAGPYKIPLLARFFKNPDGQFAEWLFKWMVGAIAKIYLGERNAMLVLVAPQRIGKSFFCGWLCPLRDRFLKSSINPDNKDHNLRLADVLIWEVEELGATTRRADIEALKAFITKPFIYERPPYGRHPIHKPANASFIGTVNYDGAGFLNDPTGTTRFLACEISHIDFDYTVNDVDELWGEAFWYFENMPGSWLLTDYQQEKQKQVNEQFETVSALADVIEHVFELTYNPEDFMSTQDIKNVVITRYQINNDQIFYNELGRVLTKLGLTRKREHYRPDRPHGAGWTGLKKRD